LVRGAGRRVDVNGSGAGGVEPERVVEPDQVEAVVGVHVGEQDHVDCVVRRELAEVDSGAGAAVDDDLRVGTAKEIAGRLGRCGL